MRIKSKILTTIITSLCMLLFLSVPVFAESNNPKETTSAPQTRQTITSIEATNGKIVVKFSGDVTGLNINDFYISTKLSNEECVLPNLTFNSEDNSFTFDSLYNKSTKKHTLAISISAAESSTKIVGNAYTEVKLKAHGGYDIGPGARIELRWGEYPEDLDSYLVLPNGQQISYWNMDAYNEDRSTLIASLDDDGFMGGPENITIYQPTNGEYLYYVHNYSNRNDSSLSTYGAQVTVYNGSKAISTFNTPTDISGGYWTVFKIVDKKIIPINIISNGEETPV